MSKKEKFQEELNVYRYMRGMAQDIPCSEEENEEILQKLKQEKEVVYGIYEYPSEDEDNLKRRFYHIAPPDVSPQDRLEYLLHKQVSLLRGIKRGVMFFVVLTIISIVSALVLYLITACK